MYSHFSHHKGSALLVALIVLTLLTVMSTVFFEKLYRFAQASNGIENSNAAYYKALGVIEEALYTGSVNKYSPWTVNNRSDGTTSGTGRRLTVSTGGTNVPMTGKGNSPYDTDYNIIGLGQPIQLVIPNGILDWSTIYFQFRVPNIPGTTSTGVDSSLSNSGIILWTFASSGASLFASGETNAFRGSDINQSNRTISGFYGTSNSGSSSQFGFFYAAGYVGTNGADCVGYQCTLKLSMIRPMVTTDGRTLTFLEYKITGFPSNIPSQYMDLTAEGYSYGFLRTRTLKFPQITTNTALDFAVLQ